jgi:oligoribonuclease
MVVGENNLIWIDLEMTGLDPQRDRIIEIATVVTGPDLEIIAQGPVIAIHQPAEVLEAMDEWNTRHHGSSGLTARVSESRTDTAAAETETLDFLGRYVAPGKSPMCGNSICQDRRFMARLMPELEAFFHYRNLDVSTLKELVRLWKPELASGFTKKGAHLALDDILESIEELKYYRTRFLKL